MDLQQAAGHGRRERRGSQDRLDTGQVVQVGHRTGWTQGRWNTGQVVNSALGTQCMRDTEKMEHRAGETQAKLDAGQVERRINQVKGTWGATQIEVQ